jgi:hypothetical protein
MPQTKTKQPKPAEGDKAQRRGAEDYERAANAPEVPTPEPPKPNIREQCFNESKRQLDALQEFIGQFTDMSITTFEALKTFKLILDRDRGSITPVENFIVAFVQMYGWQDEKGLGLTPDQIAREVEDLARADLLEEVRQARFMASRYPLPEPVADTASE